jgi:hypothetical protein
MSFPPQHPNTQHTRVSSQQAAVQQMWSESELLEQYQTWVTDSLANRKPYGVQPGKPLKKGAYVSDFMTRFLYSMPGASKKHHTPRKKICNDMSPRALFLPGHGFYAGEIDETIFNDVKEVLKQFDAVVMVETMKEDLVDLTTLLKNHGIWDGEKGGFERERSSNNPNAKAHKESQEILQLLEESNKWDRRLIAHVAESKQIRLAGG